MEMMKIIEMLSNSEKLEKLLEKEINKVVDKGDLTSVEVDNLKKVVCLVKEIAELEKEAMDLGYMDEGESGYYSPMNPPYSYGTSMNRTVNPNRFMRTGSYDASRTRRNASYGNGHSGHSIKDRMVDRLESMMDEAQTDYERQQIMDMINQIQH